MINRILPDIKVVIADDHELFRDGLKLMLSKHKEIEIAGEAENGIELIELVKKYKPDVILTDIKMPLMDGIEAVKKITADNADAAIVCLSMFDEESLIMEMLEAGAKGYLIKNSDKKEIYDAIISVYNRQPYYCHSTGPKLLKMIAGSEYNPYRKKKAEEFTEREIADVLYISSRTLEGARQRLMEKMGVKNTVGLVVYAIKHGIVKF
jgi:two-component system, NarL family, response regulator NreC